MYLNQLYNDFNDDLDAPPAQRRVTVMEAMLFGILKVNGGWMDRRDIAKKLPIPSRGGNLTSAQDAALKRLVNRRLVDMDTEYDTKRNTHHSFRYCQDP